VSDNKNLKPGWKVWRFDQMATNVNVRIDNPSESGMEHYIGLEHLDTDSLKIRRWGTPDDVEATKLMFKKGDIIFGRRRAYQRKLGVADFDGICSAHAMVLRAKPDVVLPKFLPFFMQSDLFMSRAVEISVGSLSPTINWKTMAAQEFALPPLDEQSRMADLLDEIEAARESYETCVRSIEAMKSSFASWCFSQAGNWASDSLCNLVEKLGSGKTPRGGETAYTPSGVLFLRSQNVYPGKLYLDDVARIPEEIDKQMASTRVLRDDVLLNITGASIGRCCKYDLSEPANVNQHVCIIRPSSHLAPDFLAFFLQSDLGQRQIFKHQTKGNREGLNFKQLGSFEIPLPPMSFQKSVVEALSEFKAASTDAEGRLLGLKVLKACVLAQSIA
jgi:restriction endonuclease S subunit